MQEFIQQFTQFISLHKDEILIGLLVAFLLAVIGGFWKYISKFLSKRKMRREKFKKYYETVWKKSSRLTPEEVLGIRGKKEFGFNKLYFRRPEDEQIEQRLASGDHVLVIGNPLAGKTRAIYQALKNSKKKYDVTIFKRPDTYTSLDIYIPKRFTFWRKQVLVLDDINKFAGIQGFTYLLNEFLKRNDIILATCRSGPEYEKVRNLLERELEWFGKPVEIPKVEREEAKQVAQKIGKTLPGTFDGNIGSIFVDIETMRQRFRDCSDVEKGILRSLRRLHAAGIYRGKEVFSIKRLKRASKSIKGVKGEAHQWDDWIETLKNNCFIEIDKDDLKTEETYLEQVIEDDFSPLDNLLEMLSIFAKDPDAAFDIGNEANNRGLVDLQKAAFMKVAVEAYDKTLVVWTYANNPEKYAMTQNNLGNAYRTLGEVENKSANCQLAIAAFKEALKVRTLDRFPMDYAMTQNNLGTAYSTLGEVENKSANCQLAIAAYQEALKVYTLDRFPMQYGTTQNNLGTAYRTLGEVENKSANCQLAIAAYQEALKVRTLDRFPMQYADTQSNLGTAYGTLLDVEDKPGNCKRAKRAFEEALKIYTEDLPEPYAVVIHNLRILDHFCEDVF